MSQHVSKQIAIAQKLCTRKPIFSESSLSALSKTFKQGSIGIHSKISLSNQQRPQKVEHDGKNDAKCST